MKNVIKCTLAWAAFTCTIFAQNPTPFTCSGSDGFGYYISSLTETATATTISYSNSRLSKLETETGARTTVCADLGRSMNGLAFNPHDNYLYAVSRYDPNLPTGKSGTLYRIGANCQRAAIPVTGSIIKFDSNNTSNVDAAGGNIGSGTFDLDNNYYVNTSFTNQSSTGFTNKIQKIRMTSAGATVVSTKTLTCASCTGEVQVTDIIFDAATSSLLGSNFINKRLYKIDASTGIMTPVAAGTTGLTSPVLGLYKNRTGEIRAITAAGNIYNVNPVNGAFSLIVNSNQLISQNADAASGCYAPPSISGHLFYDNNRLSDNTVNGTGTDKAGETKMYANLVQGGLVIKSSEVLPEGSFLFLGLFTGTYEVQISSIRGSVGENAPSQNLPSDYEFTGDHVGANQGHDGTPNGKLTVPVSMGVDVIEVNFGIDPKPVVLPVDFVSFKAQFQRDGILLIWKAENEINNDYFEIEKSYDGKSFLTIGRVSAGTIYQFLDRTPDSDVLYRLKQIDLNGDYKYSSIIAINRSATTDIILFPTLVSNEITVSVLRDDYDLKLLLYDLSGKQVLNHFLHFGETQIDLQVITSGIYLYTVTNSFGRTLLRDRLVKL